MKVGRVREPERLNLNSRWWRFAYHRMRATGNKRRKDATMPIKARKDINQIACFPRIHLRITPRGNNPTAIQI